MMSDTSRALARSEHDWETPALRLEHCVFDGKSVFQADQLVRGYTGHGLPHTFRPAFQVRPTKFTY